MNDKAKYAGINFIAGCLLYLVSSQTLSSGIPTPWSPGQIYLTVLTWQGIPLIVVWSLGTLALWCWNTAIWMGQLEIPQRSFTLFKVLASFSVLSNVFSLSYGIKYQGLIHTTIVTVINLLLITTLIVVGIKAQKNPSFGRNITFHWFLFAWFVSYAFPYLGELL